MRLIYGLLWWAAGSLFLLTALTFATHYYLPSAWFSWPSAHQVAAQEELSPVAAPLATAAAEVTQSAELVRTADARALLVANFIERNDSGHSSPWQPYAEWGQLLVDIADEFSLDFRLLPAIARKESTFCKSNIAQTYYNCFGYGVPASGITEAGKFDSFEAGIRTVAASLKKSYIDQGLTDPIAIMAKYCPPSAEGAGTWAEHLNQWLAEMRYDDKNAGFTEAENTDLTEFVP